MEREAFSRAHWSPERPALLRWSARRSAERIGRLKGRPPQMEREAFSRAHWSPERPALLRWSARRSAERIGRLKGRPPQMEREAFSRAHWFHAAICVIFCACDSL